MAELSSPRAGGELNSEPTTEKRNRAHKAAVDRREDSVMEPAHESVGERPISAPCVSQSEMPPEHENIASSSWSRKFCASNR